MLTQKKEQLPKINPMIKHTSQTNGTPRTNTDLPKRFSLVADEYDEMMPLIESYSSGSNGYIE